MDIFTIVARLSITFLASFFYGLERQRSHKPVGFGTFIFVAMGASALGVIAMDSQFANPVSLLSAIVTGIGFLGAGALIKGADRVFGFTTASSIWLFAIIGLTVGIGEYLISATLYGLVWLVILYDRHLEKRGIGSHRRKLSIVTTEMVSNKELKSYLALYTQKYKILSVEVKKETNEMLLIFLVQGTSDLLNKMVRNLYKEDWLKSAKME